MMGNLISGASQLNGLTTYNISALISACCLLCCITFVVIFVNHHLLKHKIIKIITLTILIILLHFTNSYAGLIPATPVTPCYPTNIQLDPYSKNYIYTTIQIPAAAQLEFIITYKNNNIPIQTSTYIYNCAAGVNMLVIPRVECQYWELRINKINGAPIR